jgi:hypothetical protein
MVKAILQARIKIHGNRKKNRNRPKLNFLSGKISEKLNQLSRNNTAIIAKRESRYCIYFFLFTRNGIKTYEFI